MLPVKGSIHVSLECGFVHQFSTIQFEDLPSKLPISRPETDLFVKREEIEEKFFTPVISNQLFVYVGIRSCYKHSRNLLICS